MSWWGSHEVKYCFLHCIVGGYVQPLPDSLQFVSPIAPVLWQALCSKVMHANKGFPLFSLNSLHCTRFSRKTSGHLCETLFPWCSVQHWAKPDSKCSNHVHAMGVASSFFQGGCFLMLQASILSFMTSLVQMQVWEMFGQTKLCGSCRGRSTHQTAAKLSSVVSVYSIHQSVVLYPSVHPSVCSLSPVGCRT